MTSPNNVQRKTVQPFGGVSPSRMRQAISQAEQAALLACVTIETVTGHAELEQVFGLFEKVWQPESGNPPVHRDMMKALAHSGNYVAGAFRGGDLIGGSVAFFEEPQHRSLHSHITGILPNVQNGHIGLALKLFQRAWHWNGEFSTCGGLSTRSSHAMPTSTSRSSVRSRSSICRVSTRR